MEFLIAYLLFGPIVAIPLGITTMTWGEMFFQGIATQVGALLLVHFALEALNYPALHKRALVEKFAAVANRKVGDIGKNSSKISDRFYAEFGHAGYYLSLLFFAFTLGVVWAGVIAFALRLRTLYSAVFITLGSALAFGFWYWVIERSLSFMAADAFFVLAVALSVVLLFYGQIRERHILAHVRDRLRRRKGFIAILSS